MRTSYKTSVPARELPAGWREAGGFAADDRVVVTLEVEDPRVSKLREGVEAAIAESERGESMPFDGEAVERIKAEGHRRLTGAE